MLIVVMAAKTKASWSDNCFSSYTAPPYGVRVAVNVPSTKRNQSGSVCLYVARACCSMFCMAISATTLETGEPMAVPCSCF